MAPDKIRTDSARATRPRVVERGVATYYARSLQGRRTASGSRFDNRKLVAAHRTLPFGTVVRVINTANGRQVDVTVVDRDPAPGARSAGVIIDLSRAAASALDFIEEGRAPVRLAIVRTSSFS